MKLDFAISACPGLRSGVTPAHAIPDQQIARKLKNFAVPQACTERFPAVYFVSPAAKSGGMHYALIFLCSGPLYQPMR